MSLVYLCHFYRLDEVAKYWENVLIINNWQQERISQLIIEKLFGTIENKKIAILGFAFKANTNDIRESPAIKVCKDLLLEGAYLSVYDPKVEEDKIFEEFNKLDKVRPQTQSNDLWDQVNSVEKALSGADAAVILTEWDEFKRLNWEKLSSLMRKPAWIFDTRNILDTSKLNFNNINIWMNGKDISS